MTHTPGPWHIGSDHGDPREQELDYVYDQSGWPFFVGVQETRTGKCDYHPATGIQSVEDARLIAAAPDLLAALDCMVKVFNAKEPPDAIVGFAAIERGRGAIAKAEGAE